MKTKDIKNLSVTQLEKELGNFKKEQFNLRIQKHYNKNKSKPNNLNTYITISRNNAKNKQINVFLRFSYEKNINTRR